MPLTSREEPVRIDLPTPGEWVDVKPRLSKSDMGAVQRRMLGAARIRTDQLDGLSSLSPGDLLGDDGLPAAELIEALTWDTLEIAIVGWSFYEGKPKPEDIHDLDEASYDAIVAALNELYPSPRKDDEAKNSESSGPTHTSDEVASPLSLAGSR